MKLHILFQNLIVSLIIAVNTRLLLPDHMEGISRYIYETTRRMVLAHPEDEFHFFFDRPFDKKYIFADNVTAHILSPPSRHPLLWYLWFEWAVPRALKKVKAEVFLSGDMYLSMASATPSLMVSHDLNYEHYPEYLPWSARKFMSYYSPKYHRKADHLIAVSEATKSDICATYKLSPENISVAYNALPDGFKPLNAEEGDAIRNKHTAGQPYFVYVGSLHPRKNVRNLLLAFEHFKNNNQLPHKLVIFGRVAFKTKDIFETLDKMKHKSQVIFLEDSQVSVPEIMGAAEALCYVSLFEGFGIPILEAMACEIPVITSTVSAMPEVAGDAALLVDPKSPEQIAEAMGKIVLDAELKSGLIQQGKVQKTKFSWAASAETIYAQLEKICKIKT